MNKELQTLFAGVKIDDPVERNAAGRLLEFYSKLPPDTRAIILPAIHQISEDPNIKVENLRLNELSIELFQELNVMKTTKEASTGVLMFVVAFVGALVNLPCFLLLSHVSSILRRMVWRYMGLALGLLPRVVYDVWTNSATIGKVLLDNVLPTLLLAALHTGYVYLVYSAATHTFVAHTLLLCSIATTFITTWKIAQRTQYTTIEYIGVGINVLGTYLCCCEGDQILTGDLIAIFSSIVFAVYFVLNRYFISERSCPVSIYLFLLAVFGLVISCVFALLLDADLEFFSTEPKVGLFGCFGSWRNFMCGFLGLGLLSGFAYHYLTAVTRQQLGSMFVNVCYNFVPFLSQVTAYMLSAQHEFPGAFTAFGGAILFSFSMQCCPEFIGCTLLAMDYQDQQEMAHIPTGRETHTMSDSGEERGGPGGRAEPAEDHGFSKLSQRSRRVTLVR